MTTEAVRLDKWLWATRFFKTRSLAQQAVKGGKVELNGAKPKPSRSLKLNDRLRISRGELLFEVEVLGLTEKRVSAALARELYSETESGKRAREKQIEQRRLERAAGAPPDRRPDKRQRRQLQKFRRGS